MTSMGQFDFQGLIDIAIIVVIALACLKSFLGDSSSQNQNRRRAIWQAELKALEETLRELISEASAASSNLDRRLLQRKRELESLLQKIDDSQTIGTEKVSQDPVSSKEARTNTTRSLPRNESSAIELPREELPNDSWLQPRDSVSSTYLADKKQTASQTLSRTPNSHQAYKRAALEQNPNSFAAANSSGNSPADDLTEEKLLELIDAADDTVSLSNQVSTLAAKSQQQKKQLSQTMGLPQVKTAQQQEEEDIQAAIEEQTFQQTSIMDATTYRIARRLLLSGKELHIVARKLELPVSEIRLLDSLMRKEAETDGHLAANNSEADLPTAEYKFPKKATSLNSQISVEKSKNAPRNTARKAALKSDQSPGFQAVSFSSTPEVSENARSLEQDIEREVALL